MATYSDMEELILVAHRAGSSAEVDEAITLHKPLEAFLAQSKEEATTMADGYERLERILRGEETQKLTLLRHSRPEWSRARVRTGQWRQVGPACSGASGSI